MAALQSIWQDVRYAGRSLRRAPVFAAAAILTLGLGIGANAALFTVTRGVLLDTLPVQEPEQLVEIGCINPNNPEEACRTHFPGFLMYRDRTELLSGVFAFAPTPDLAADIDGRAEVVAGLMLSGNAFSVLGMSPHIGRLLTPADDQIGAPLATVLSHEFWQRRFGGDDSVLGRTLRLGNQVVTIVGVTPQDFRGLTIGVAPDVMVPIASAEIFRQPGSLEARAAWWVYVMGRLKPGVTIPQAQAALEPTFHATMRVTLDALPPQAAAGFKDFVEGFKFRITSAASGGISGFRQMLEQPLRILWGVVGLVLLITCANLAGLSMSRLAQRQREFGVRLALGAGRGRVVRQVLVEALLLAVAGGGLGLIVAQWAAPIALGAGTGDTGLKAVDLRPDPMVLTFTAVISIATGLLIAMAAVWRVAAADPLESWRVAPLSARAPLARTLVASQIAVSTVLVIAAALFLRSFGNARDVDPGFDRDHLVTVTVAPGMAGYDSDAAIAYLNRAIAAVNALPGVASSSYNAVPIATGLVSQIGVGVPGFTGSASQMVTGQNRVGPRFVETMGLRMIAGRDLRAGDETGPVRAAVANERFARFFFNTTDVIGRTFVLGDNERPYTIVGIVEDAHDRSVLRPVENWIYIPWTGEPRVRLTIRASEAVSPLLSAVEQAIQRVDPAVPVYGIRTFIAQIDETLRRQRLLAILAGTFGVVALALAAIGVYAMFSTSVTRRRREIGIRMAVGATGHRIAGMIAREVTVVLFLGLAAGVTAAVAAQRVIRGQLFNVEPTDPRWFALAVGVLLTTTLLAVFLPTRKAVSLHPAATLRSE